MLNAPGRIGAVGRSGGIRRAASVVFEAETDALIAAMTTPPNATRAGHINTLMAALKNTGVLARLDHFSVQAAADAQAASLNWCNPAGTAITLVGSPAFVADRGYTGSGTNNYLDTGHQASAQTHYTQDDASLFAFCITNTSSVSGVIGASVTNARIVPRHPTNGVVALANGPGTNHAITGATSVGLTGATRSNSTQQSAFKNTTVSGPSASVSTALSNSNFVICAGAPSSNTNPAQVGAAGFGASLSSQNIADLYAALNAYMTAVGAV